MNDLWLKTSYTSFVYTCRLCRIMLWLYSETRGEGMRKAALYMYTQAQGEDECVCVCVCGMGGGGEGQEQYHTDLS